MGIREDKPIIFGTTADGNIRPVLVGNDGSLVSGGGGGGGGITEAEVTAAIEAAGSIDDILNVAGNLQAGLGFPSDVIASTATAIASLISLIKFSNNALSAIQGSQLGISSDSPPVNNTQVTTLLAGLRRIADLTSFPATVFTGASASINTLLFLQDVSNFSFLTLEITGTFSAVIAVQGRTTSSGVIYPVNVISANGEIISNITAPGLYYIPKIFNFIRILPTTFGSGGIQGVLTGYPVGNPPLIPSKVGSDFFSAALNVTTSGVYRPAQPTRKKLIITASKNNTQTCYFAFGAVSVSATSYAFALEPGDTYFEEVNICTATISAFSPAASVAFITDWI